RRRGRPAHGCGPGRGTSEPEALLGHGDEAPFTGGSEHNGSVALREDRVVPADTGAGAGPEARPALADDDRPRGHALAVEDLDAEHLRVGVAAVPRRAESLLVSHLVDLLRFERCEGAFALGMGALVLQRRLDLLGRPAADLLRDLH